MKTCKCDPYQGEECAVCNPRLGADEQLVMGAILGRMFAPRPEGVPYTGQNEAERALMVKARASGQAQRERASKPRVVLSRNDVFMAANKHAERQCLADNRPAAKGWRGQIAAILGFEWRVVKRHFPDIDEEIRNHLENWKP